MSVVWLIFENLYLITCSRYCRDFAYVFNNIGHVSRILSSWGRGVWSIAVARFWTVWNTTRVWTHHRKNNYVFNPLFTLPVVDPCCCLNLILSAQLLGAVAFGCDCCCEAVGLLHAEAITTRFVLYTVATYNCWIDKKRRAKQICSGTWIGLRGTRSRRWKVLLVVIEWRQ